MRTEDFEGFLVENENRIYCYILRFVDVDDDALDLVQNVFIAFYKNIAKIEDKTALAYLYKMAHNMSINWQKQHRRIVLKAPSEFQNVPGNDHPSPSTDYTAVNEAISALPPKLAAVIQLKYFDNLSYKEISSKLSISIKTVDSLLVKAKCILRKYLIVDDGGTYVFRNKQ